VVQQHLKISVLLVIAAICSNVALTGELVPLFHPRQQQWFEHFVWDEAGVSILGLTPVGRATVTALNMNNEVISEARRNWVRLGWRPKID